MQKTCQCPGRKEIQGDVKRMRLVTMQMRFDFAVLKEIVNFLLHNCVLNIKMSPLSRFFFKKKLDSENKTAIMTRHRG